VTTFTVSADHTVPNGRRASVHAFTALLMRDLRVLRRNGRSFVLRTVMQPVLFTFVFLYVFPKIGQGVGGPEANGTTTSFGSVLVPGLLAVAIIFQGIQAVALPLVQEFSFTKEIEDRVLAPLPIWAVGLGKIVNGAVQAMLAAVVVFPAVRFIHAAGQEPQISLGRPHVFVAVLVLAAAMGACLGMLIGTTFAPPQVPLIFSIVVLPITMLGCIYYPWAALDAIPWLKYAVLVNPLVYMSEGMRYALVPGVDHMPVLAIFGLLATAVVVLGSFSLRQFRRRVLT
jgi:ABC-2 type transport system permease protein